MSKWYLELRGGVYVDADTREEARAKGQALVTELTTRRTSVVMAPQTIVLTHVDDLEIIDSYKISTMGSNEAAAQGLG